MKIVIKKPGKDFEVIEVSKDPVSPYEDSVYRNHLRKYIEVPDYERVELSKLTNNNLCMFLGEASGLFPESGANIVVKNYVGETFVGTSVINGTIAFAFAERRDDWSISVTEFTDVELLRDIFKFYDFEVL